MSRPEASRPDFAMQHRLGEVTKEPFTFGRRVLGLICLATTVALWTASNFLASTIFADDTYSKPYFVTWINSAFFIIPLIPILVHKAYKQPEELRSWKDELRTRTLGRYMPVKDEEEVEEEVIPNSSQETAGDGIQVTRRHSLRSQVEAQEELDSGSSAPLTLFETMRLSFEFCILWTLANYFVSACLQYTTVASSTILTSTSSVFTLIFGVMFRVETFTFRKTIGIFASLAGIVLISSIDLSGDNNEHRGDFPEKSSQEIAVGNILALISAVVYGMYAVLMKKRITDESRINMPLFFGFVGAVNFLLFWPGLIILHFTGIETFELPPDGRVMIIILCNSLASLISDMTWAYAVLLMSPLVTTVGLSLTIPCSLIGQMIINNQTAGVWYWIGALLVLVSFIFVSQEDKPLDDAQSDAKRHDDPVRSRSTSHGHIGDETAGL